MSQGINLIFPLLIVPFLIERITLEGFGIIILIQVIMSYGNTLVDYGYNMIGVKEIGICEKKNDIEKILSESLYIKTILLLLSLLLVLFSGLFVNNLIGEWKLIFYGWLGVLGYAFYPIWYFQGIEKMHLISIINISSKLIVFISILYFVNTIEDIDLVMLIFSLGFIINSIISWFLILFLHKLKIRKSSFNDLKLIIKVGKHIFFSNIIVQVYSNIVIVFSSGILSASQIGVLGVYLKLKDIAESIIGPIQQAVFPTITIFVNNNEVEKLKKLILNTLLILMGIMLIYFFMLFIFFEDVNRLLFDNQTNIKELIYFGFILCFIYYGGIYTKVIVSFNKMKWILNSTILSGLVAIVFSYYFMNTFALIGALIVIILSYLINSFLSYYYYRRLVYKKV